MPEMKTLNGYEVVDAQARAEIKELLAIDFATEQYVDNAIENIHIPEVDLSEHALKSEIPTKVSQLANDKKYITLAEVPEVDLSEYATEAYVDNKVANMDIPDSCNAYIVIYPGNHSIVTDKRTIEYLERIWVGETPPAVCEGYAVARVHKAEADSSVRVNYLIYTNYGVLEDREIGFKRNAKNSWEGSDVVIRTSYTIPTKTSQLTNDSGFITSNKLNGLASEEYVDQAIASAVFGENVEDLFIVSIQNLEARMAAVEARLDVLEGK